MDANRFLQDLAIHPYLDPYALLMRPPPFTKVSEEGFSTKSSSQFGQGQNCISIKLLQVYSRGILQHQEKILNGLKIETHQINN